MWDRPTHTMHPSYYTALDARLTWSPMSELEHIPTENKDQKFSLFNQKKRRDGSVLFRGVFTDCNVQCGHLFLHGGDGWCRERAGGQTGTLHGGAGRTFSCHQQVGKSEKKINSVFKAGIIPIMNRKSGPLCVVFWDEENVKLRFMVAAWHGVRRIEAGSFAWNLKRIFLPH